MKSSLILLLALFGLTVEAKIATSISGENALTFVLESERFEGELVHLDGYDLEGVKLSEKRATNGIEAYRHTLEFSYRSSNGENRCVIKVDLGLEVVRSGRPPITRSAPVIRRIGTACK